MAYSPSLVADAQSAFNLVLLRSKFTFDVVPQLSRVPRRRQWLPASGGTCSSLVSRIPLAVLSPSSRQLSAHVVIDAELPFTMLRCGLVPD